ncbi:uncharacterized protein [Nicotiana tomentosiformis]|uniref:uncharacterized protein n=1 Tax=Nicotiana tomentosiformis TaxID=4098 RepID=UPI00388C4603
MAIGESDEETEVSVFYLKDRNKFLSKERLFELLIELIDESKDVNNEKEQLSKKCVILKAKCKNLELRACETESENTVLKNQVHTLDITILEHRSENLKLKLGTGKKTVGDTQLTLEENVGKMKDELYKRDEQKNEITCLSVLDNDPFLWYKRLGHASLSQLNKLVSKDLVIGLPNIKFKEDKVCESCARVKQKNSETTRNQLASIRYDHGIEFENAKFAEFCDELEESVHVIFDETNILSERKEQDDEAIGLHIYWVNAMQDELNQFERSQVWHLVPKPKDRSVIGTKWVFRNKLDEDGIVTKNKTRLMDIKSAFLNVYLKEEVFVRKPHGFEIKECPDYVYKLDKALYGLKQAPRAWYERLSKFLLDNGLATREKMYRAMIGSLLYLTASRPGIVYNVDPCSRFQENPKESHLTTIKRILRYLKGTTDLCLWYPKVCNFNLLGYGDADYAGFLVDRKNTLGMAHFLSSCLVSWATKKQIFMALSTAKAECVAVTSCCAQLLWIKQQLMDFGIDTNTEGFSMKNLVYQDYMVGQAEEPQKLEESFKSATEGEEPVSSKAEQVTSRQNIKSDFISDVAENLENICVLVGTIVGVETTESGKIYGKNKKKKEKQSEGVIGDIRGKGEERVAESSPTPFGLPKEIRVIVIWSEEDIEEEESWREE